MIAIKDIEMPKNCIVCPLYVGKTGEGYCAITHKWNATGGLNRLNDCPLTEIVTCKDCKYARQNNDNDRYCYLSGKYHDIYYYCANGKIKE